MSWRSVIVSNPAKLSHKDKHLVIKQDEEACVPLEDISVIVVETQQASITSSLLDQLARKTIPLIVCGPSHLPTGLFLSFQQHSRFLKVLKSQMEQTLPFRKNCWQMVVKRKIENQAKCLELLEKKHCNELINISKQVKSGDPDNRESAAASVYFDSYMPSISRQEDNTVNAALNYGYSIMRGAVARSLAAYGFLPAVGIHHRSELNAFNLADDFMEVLRPLVDLWVGQNIEIDEEFCINKRKGLVSLLSKDILIDGARQRVIRAIDIMISSYKTATTSGEAKYLKLPELLPIIEHVWE